MGGSEIKKRVIGLTGNSGSGKSSAAAYLEELGAYVIDADRIAREISDTGKAGALAVRDAFGEVFFRADGSLDRHKLGEYVFSRPAELKRLNEVLHPLIIKEVKERMGAATGTVVLDCALLVDVGLTALTGEVWLIAAGQDSKIDRIKKRDGIGHEHARNRLLSQLDEEKMRKYADVVIENNGTLEELKKQVREQFYGQSK
ncbi:MAG: dephospho-CoA kinase [Christensenella sp.]|uniref:dephospho-CoA kinase n=1 Tax=Christensenella sp. TaxID=1935934 RepID=UPI002B1F7E6F|nr:dephospho-CoA kinase [Christensenella sp.]MEA5002768.1 dephospho-CoA kinase [Christensenella sp.]